MPDTPATTTAPSALPAAASSPAPAQQPRAAPETNVDLSIPGFEKMSFAQQRQAQDQLAARRNFR